MRPSFNLRNQNIVEDELEQLGMKKTLVRSYIALLSNGESSADELSEVSGVHRVDIYKRLEEMTALGFCNLRLGRPKTYAPVDPGIVVDFLLKNRTNTLRYLTREKTRLVSSLRSVTDSPSPKKGNEKKKLFYELIVGRRQIYDATRKILRHANQEVARVISPNGIRRSYKLGLLNEYTECSKRGVKVQFITDTSKLSERFINYCADNFELRHSKESSMKLTIVDRRIVMLSGVLDDHNMSLDSATSRCLVSRDENLADVLSIIFRNLWSSAKPVRP